MLKVKTVHYGSNMLQAEQHCLQNMFLSQGTVSHCILLECIELINFCMINDYFITLIYHVECSIGEYRSDLIKRAYIMLL